MEVRNVESKEECEQILALQQINLRHCVAVQEWGSKGFVTIQHDLAQLTRTGNATPHIIAVDNKVVVGYALVVLPRFKKLIPDLKSLVDIFHPEIIVNSVIMGQICIADVYRGKGVFFKLYDKMAEQYSGMVDYVITEVSTENPRSMQAHFKVGFREYKRRVEYGEEWLVLIWEWNS